MKVKVTLDLQLVDEELCIAAERALQPDNKVKPPDMELRSLRRGDSLLIEVEGKDLGEVLYAIEDILTCLKPLMGLTKLTRQGNR